MIHWRSPTRIPKSVWIVGSAMVMALKFARSRNIAEHLWILIRNAIEYMKSVLTQLLEYSRDCSPLCDSGETEDVKRPLEVEMCCNLSSGLRSTHVECCINGHLLWPPRCKRCALLKVGLAMGVRLTAREGDVTHHQQYMHCVQDNGGS